MNGTDGREGSYKQIDLLARQGTLTGSFNKLLFVSRTLTYKPLIYERNGGFGVFQKQTKNTRKEFQRQWNPV